MSPWARGLVVGLLVSLPDALVTKAYAPILIIGSIGGLLIGIAAARWAAQQFVIRYADTPIS
jgi:hypothetical protein